MARNPSKSCNQLCMGSLKDKQNSIGNGWVWIGHGGLFLVLKLGRSVAKSALDFELPLFAMRNSMTRNASKSCNQLCMGSLKDKQNSIGNR